MAILTTLRVGRYYWTLTGALYYINGCNPTSLHPYSGRVVAMSINRDHRNLPEYKDFERTSAPILHETDMFREDGTWSAEHGVRHIRDLVREATAEEVQQSVPRSPSSAVQQRVAHLSITTWNTPETKASFEYSIDFPFTLDTTGLTHEQQKAIKEVAKHGFKRVMEKLMEFGVIKPDLEDLFARLK